MRIARQGQAGVVIQLPGEAAPAERYAAEELRSHLRQITGAEFAVVSGPVEGPAIRLGRALAQPVLPGFDWAALREDGCLVRTAGDALLLAGATPRGTLYAVYEFLDRVLGCRWLTPECSIIPEHTELEIGDLDLTHVPTFRYREPFFSAVWHSAAWAARNRVNGSFYPLTETHGGKWSYAADGFAHTFYALVPPERYFEAHPEYFSEINGERTYLDAQLCLTNNDLFELVCERIREWMRQDPDARIVSITQNDWNGWCTCAKCRAIDEAEGSPSGTMIHFVNRVAERLEAEFPQVYFDTFAYTYTVHPTKTIRPRHNVIVRLCNITPCCDAHPLEGCEQNRWFLDVLRGWGGRAPEVFVWDYFNNFHQYFQPFPNLDALAADVQLYARSGVTGMFCQGDGLPAKGCGDMAELRAWLFSRLLWEPEQDAWALVDEFLRLYYGAAAPIIREYLDLLHAPARAGTAHFHLYTPLESDVVAGDFADRAHALFDRAEAAVAAESDRLERVRAARLPVDYLTWQRELRFTVRDGKYQPATPELAERMGRFFTRAAAHGVGALREGGNPLGQLARLADGFEILTIAADGVRADVIPGLGGRLVSLRDTATDMEWLHWGQPDQLDYPFAGGYEEYTEHRWRSPGWNDVYQVEEHTADTLTVSARLSNLFRLRRTYRLAGRALHLTSVIENAGTERRAGCFRSMPDIAVPALDGGISFRTRDGSWRDAAPWQDSADDFGSGWLEGEQTPWGACRITRPGGTLTLNFDPERLEKVLFDWDRSHAYLRPGLYSPPYLLDPGQSYTVEQVWTLG